jgi:hypothetical protein
LKDVQYFFLRLITKLVHQGVDLPVSGLGSALAKRRHLMARPGGGKLPVKLQHLLKKIRDISAYLIQLMI